MLTGQGQRGAETDVPVGVAQTGGKRLGAEHSGEAGDLSMAQPGVAGIPGGLDPQGLLRAGETELADGDGGMEANPQVRRRHPGCNGPATGLTGGGWGVAKNFGKLGLQLRVRRAEHGLKRLHPDFAPA